MSENIIIAVIGAIATIIAAIISRIVLPSINIKKLLITTVSISLLVVGILFIDIDGSVESAPALPETLHVTLSIPSHMKGAEVFIDDDKAKIIKQRSNFFILDISNQQKKSYAFSVRKNNISCSKIEFVRENNQKINITDCEDEKNIIEKTLYVWNFKTQLSTETPLTRTLTDAFEEAIIKRGCSVLERRNYSRLVEQIDIESMLGQKKFRKKIGAKSVIFGTVHDDGRSLSIKVSIEVQSLDSGIILKKESASFMWDEQEMARNSQSVINQLAHQICPNKRINHATNIFSPKKIKIYISEFQGVSRTNNKYFNRIKQTIKSTLKQTNHVQMISSQVFADIVITGSMDIETRVSTIHSNGVEQRLDNTMVSELSLLASNTETETILYQRSFKVLPLEATLHKIKNDHDLKHLIKTANNIKHNE